MLPSLCLLSTWADGSANRQRGAGSSQIWCTCARVYLSSVGLSLCDALLCGLCYPLFFWARLVQVGAAGSLTSPWYAYTTYSRTNTMFHCAHSCMILVVVWLFQGSQDLKYTSFVFGHTFGHIPESVCDILFLILHHFSLHGKGKDERRKGCVCLQALLPSPPEQ